MRLLDVADVKRGTGTWYRGFQQDSRACGVEVSLVDACDPYDQGDLIGGASSAPGMYDTLPFGIVANLRRPVNCAAKDDEAWLKAALGDLEELALGRALVVQPVSGTDSWIGSSQVQDIPGAVDPADPDALGGLLTDARTLWFATVAGVRPIVHVAPSLAPALVKAGILKINCGDPNDSVCCVWGDQVVINAGYDAPGGPSMFLTGPIQVMLQPAQTQGWQIDTRTNRTLIQANELAVVDTDPCQIVRVGAVPASAFRPVLTEPVISGMQITSVKLTNNPAGQTWKLDWGDGTVVSTMADGANGSHTYANPGTYTLLATTSDGSTATRLAQVPDGGSMVGIQSTGESSYTPPVTTSTPRQVTGAVDTEPPAAESAVAGTPGHYLPAGAVPPRIVGEMNGLTADPSTPWTEGQSVPLGNGNSAHWNGSAWRAGTAPAAG